MTFKMYQSYLLNEKIYQHQMKRERPRMNLMLGLQTNNISHGQRDPFGV